MHLKSLFAAILIAALPVSALASDPAPATLTLEGRGSVAAAPDMATVTSGVVTDGKTAREALDANTAAMTALIEALKQAGIEPKDIQTSGFSVQPQYVYSDQRNENGYQQPPRIAGYQVSNQVSVTVKTLDNLGPVLDRMVTVGANTISGIAFARAETGDLLDEARRKAVANARAKAELYAKAAGVRLARIMSISEFGGETPQPLYRRAEMAMADAAPVPVEAGQLEFAISVNIVWEIEGE